MICLKHIFGKKPLCLLFLSLFLLVNNNSARAQLSTWYEPGIAVSSALCFSDKFAHESAVWLQNSFCIGRQFPIYPSINLGYARRRSYQLEYSYDSEQVDDAIVEKLPAEIFYLFKEYSGVVTRNVFILQVGVQAKFWKIRKLRKTMHPFIGMYLQSQFGKIPDVDPYSLPKSHRHSIVFDFGTDLMCEKWPKLFISIQVNTGGGMSNLNRQVIIGDNPPIDTYYFRKELPCLRLVVGIKL